MELITHNLQGIRLHSKINDLIGELLVDLIGN